jgi:hypothetical protein
MPPRAMHFFEHWWVGHLTILRVGPLITSKISEARLFEAKFAATTASLVALYWLGYLY